MFKHSSDLCAFFSRSLVTPRHPHVIMHEGVDESLGKICKYQQNVPQHYYLFDTLVFNYFLTATTHVFLPTLPPSWISQNANHTSRPKTDTAPKHWEDGVWCLVQSLIKKKKNKGSWTLQWQRLHCECYRSSKFLKPVSKQWMISTATTTFQSVTTPRQHSSRGQYAGKPAKFGPKVLQNRMVEGSRTE